MKYFNLRRLNKIFTFNTVDARILPSVLSTNRKSISTSTKISNQENILHIDNVVSYLSVLRNKIERTEDLIPKIIEEIEAKPYFFQCMRTICEDLRKIFPDAKISLYGSSESNLALENADVDISLIFNGDIKPSKYFLSCIKNKLKSHNFIYVMPIYSARVPIIKCVHQNNVSCDISFSNNFCVFDSSLIRFILSIDNRIRQLILILKYLLKREVPLLNTHCLILMIVFFLQTLSEPLIPPISHLQKLAGRKEMLNGWDVSFTRKKSLLEPVSNQLTVIELLEKFFQFYGSFEFSMEVISPFTAKSYFKPHFMNVSLLPQEFKLYKEKVAESDSLKFDCHRAMCIQGFFNHSANVSQSVTKQQLRDFQNCCRRNALIGQELLYKNQSEEFKLEFLLNLFQRTESIPNEAQVNAIPEAVLCLEKINSNDSNSSADNIRKNWWTYILESVIVIMKEVMKSEVIVKPEDIDDKSSNVMEVKILSCELPYWELATKRRKEAAKNLTFPQDISPLEKQKLISNELEKIILETSEKTSVKFDIKCEFLKNPTRVRLKFEPTSTDFYFGLPSCYYLSKFIPKLIL